MNKKIRAALIVLLALVLVGSLGMLLRQSMQYRAAEESYTQAKELAEPFPPPVEEPEEPTEEEPVEEEAPAPADEYAAELQNKDIDALREVNSDVLGWIEIPGTAISYPLVQGTDNQYYLEHTWKKEASSVGSIFLEAKSSADLSDFNTVVYGHRMLNGSMFASLKYYKDQSYWAEHPYVYITDGQVCRRYEIFAAYEVSITGTTYQIVFPDEESKQAFLDTCTGWSVIDTDVTPTVQDQILTLSTCTGNGHATRWVVQAVLENRGE